MGTTHNRIQRPSRILDIGAIQLANLLPQLRHLHISGTTLIAADNLGRICYGMELDPRYVDVAVKRWENHTGKKAQKITI